MHPAIRRSLVFLHPDEQPVQELFECISSMPLALRKATVTVSRVQVSPTRDTRVYSRLSKELSTPYVYRLRGGIEALRTLEQLLSPVHAYIESPILSGYISMMARNLPFLRITDIEEAFKAGVSKEMQAATEVYYPARPDWNCILSKSVQYRSTHSLLPWYTADPNVHTELFRRFQGTKAQLANRRLYPDYSKKTIGREATANLELCTRNLEDSYANSTLGLEQLYHRRGIQIAGYTECRWAWKYGELKPRIYYARGPDQYYSSRYIQDPFNIILDAFPMTNRRERFFTSSMQFRLEETVFIYDFWSFTSSLHDIRYFTEDIAKFYEGIDIEVVDTREGPITIALSAMIREYNAHCNCDPKFDVSSLSWDRSVEEEVLTHNAGMLGVPGNISSCTLEHGLHLVEVLGSMNAKTVGDDAVGGAVLPEPVNRRNLEDDLSNIGRLSKDKMEYWDYHPDDDDKPLGAKSWHYTKRPFNRDLSRVTLGAQVVWPPIAIILSWTDSFHTVVPDMNEYKRFKKISSMLFSFTLQFAEIEVDEETESFCNRFIELCRHESGLERFCASPANRQVFCPRTVADGIDVRLYVDSIWDLVVTLPVEYGTYPIWRSQVEVGFEFECRPTRAIKLARDLGYCDSNMVMRTFVVSSDPEAVQRFISRSSAPPVVSVLLYCTIPDWLLSLVVDESRSNSVEDLSWDIDDMYDLEDSWYGHPEEIIL
jgi:hypothetical protein